MSGAQNGRCVFLNSQLIETGLVELDITPYAQYSFIVEGKSGPTALEWQDYLLRAKKDFDSGKPPLTFEWFEPVAGASGK
jgi:hypothetical protein